MSEQQIEIRLPKLDGTETVEQLLALELMHQALSGEQVDWPADATEGWDLLLGWAERIPGTWAGFTAGATSIRLANGGTITRLTRKGNRDDEPNR
jgi:hypothetical protein